MRRGLQVVERHLELNPDDVRALYLGAGALIQTDARERALEWATRARTGNEADSMVLYNVACVYSLGGMVDDAIGCLDKAVANGFGHREWLLNDGDLDNVREDPRFQTLLQKL
jgi:tetratricopeptide (TPR) repeat protein